jgi:thiamine biosynthesis lipoprotein
MAGKYSVMAAFCVLLSACAKPELHLEGTTMATTWRVTVDGAPTDQSDVIRNEVQAKLDALEHIFSNWQNDSAVSRWNASRSTEFQPVPRELAEVANLALRIAKETDGAMDITIAPLIDLWGFGPAKPQTTPPNHEAVKHAMQHCGWQKLEVQIDPPMLRKSDPELTINLSTLVEGFASDTIAGLLQSSGHVRVLVDVGGAINARGKAWTIAVQEPGAATGDALATMQLTEEAVTTAGTYRKHFDQNGKRFSHIIDPRTGHPVSHSLISVSVFAKRAVIADGYDTGLLVLGPDKGRELADKLGLKTIFITAQSQSEQH